MGLKDRVTVEVNGSQEDLDSSAVTVEPDGSGIVWTGGVSLNTKGSPAENDEDEDPDNKSPSLSLSSNPTPGEMGSVSQLDKGCKD